MTFTLIEKIPEPGNIWTFRFQSSELTDWTPGQYLHYTLPHPNPDKEGDERYFTIASAPCEGFIQITTRISDSTFKQALRALDIGQTIEADGLEGDFTWTDTDMSKVFIAGGIGITPFRSMIVARDNAGLPLPVHLLYATRDKDIVFKDELDFITNKYDEMSVSYLIGGRFDYETLAKRLPNLLSNEIYISGPDPMVEALGKELLDAGLLEKQLKRDWFPGYDSTSY